MKSQKTINFLFSIFSSLFFLNPFPVFSQSPPTINITSNTTWTKSNSPYSISIPVNVNPDVTLTIEPGVIIKLGPDASFQIEGELIARGTVSDSIFFIQAEQGIRWQNIKFFPSSPNALCDDDGNYTNGCVIEYSRIEGASKGAIVCDVSTPFIHANTISGNVNTSSLPWGGGIFCDYSSPVIFENTICNNSANVGGGLFCWHSYPLIYDNLISNNVSHSSGGGIYLSYSSPVIHANIIINNSSVQNGGAIAGYSNSGEPLYLSDNIISYNSSYSHGGAISFDDILFMSGNTVSFNESISGLAGGIHCSFNYAIINNNNIFNNKPFDIFSNYVDIDATNNWWGTTDKDSIDAHICDFFDYSSYGKVSYDPFLTSAIPLYISSLTLKTDDTYSTDLSALLVYDILYIELIALDGDASHQDITEVYVINKTNYSSITVNLIETSLNTGIYRGVSILSTNTIQALSSLKAEKGDDIKIVSAADSDVYIEFLSIVPVELSLFSAVVDNYNSVTLHWQTLSETNNYGFEIQRSIDKFEYYKIGFVLGNGTTSEEQNYLFSDNNVNSGTFYYRLKQIDLDGSYEYSYILKVDLSLPGEFILEQNYPNPFNPETIIKYCLPEESLVTLNIFSVYGQLVKTLLSEVQLPGFYHIIWDGTNENGVIVSSGIYIYSIQTNNFSSYKKMLFIK